jgi:hypothetical protein
MSLPIKVEAHSGYRANERPMWFDLDGVIYSIDHVEAQWYSPDAQYFKVLSAGRRYLLRLEDSQDLWTLQSAYDGAELFTRANIQLLTIDDVVIKRAEQVIESCEFCNVDEAEIPFDEILDRMTDRAGENTEYVLLRPAVCPNCHGSITEKTLVETSGGFDLERWT